MTAGAPFAPHRSLVRRCLREARLLPDEITRAHFRNAIFGRCRRPYGKDLEKIPVRISKSVNALENLFLRMRAARSGQLTALDELLEVAFARIGPLRGDFLEPYLREPPAPTDPPLPFPSSAFPRYAPALVALLTSPISSPSETRPASASSLRALPSTVTRVWAEFPDQDPPAGKMPAQGVVHPKRQVNMRRKARARWIERIVGPPLGDVRTLDGRRGGAEARAAMGLDLSPERVARGEKMLDVLVRCATWKEARDLPRFSLTRWVNDRPTPSGDERPPPFRVPPSPPHFLPVRVSPSHPHFPSPSPPNKAHLDPLSPSLPPNQRPPKLDPLRAKAIPGAERGPRPLTARLLSRRYARILDMVPSLVYDPTPAPTRSDAVTRQEVKMGIDRSWMTQSPPGGGRVLVRRPEGWQGWTEGGEARTLGGRQTPPMTAEDLAWL